MLLSTHIVSDVESVASDIAIVSNGRLLRRAAPEQLLSPIGGQIWEFVTSSDDLPRVQARFAVSRQVRTSEGVRVRVLSPLSPAPQAVLVPPDLEDAYLSVIRGAALPANPGVAVWR